MKARISVLLLLAVCCVPGRAQTAKKTNPDQARSNVLQHDSGPLTWVKSDVNPKTVFWIQGRFVPVDDANYQGDALVVTILCSIREHECLEFDSTSLSARSEQVWIGDYKPVTWDDKGILATKRSLDGCTDETLKIRFSPPSVLLVNSPVLPISANCRKINGYWDKIMANGGSGLAAQTEQDTLVPTRGYFPFQDVNNKTGKTPTPAQKKKP